MLYQRFLQLELILKKYRYRDNYSVCEKLLQISGYIFYIKVEIMEICDIVRDKI